MTSGSYGLVVFYASRSKYTALLFCLPDIRFQQIFPEVRLQSLGDLFVFLDEFRLLSSSDGFLLLHHTKTMRNPQKKSSPQEYS